MYASTVCENRACTYVVVAACLSRRNKFNSLALSYLCVKMLEMPIFQKCFMKLELERTFAIVFVGVVSYNFFQKKFNWIHLLLI